MNVATTFRAPWSRQLILVSAIMTVICLTTGILLHKQIYPFASAGVFSIILLLSVILPFLAIPFSITGYTLQKDKLLIHRLGWNTTIDLDSLEHAEYDEKATNDSFRLCGNGGLYSFTGWFTSTRLGKYRGFFTDTQKTVVLTFPNRKIVISPEDPHRFVEQILQNKNNGYFSHVPE